MALFSGGSPVKAVRAAARAGDRLPAGTFGPGHVRALQRLLEDRDVAVRAEAARGLVDAGALQPVVTALAAGTVSDWDLQADLVPVLPALADAMDDAPAGPRAELARVLVRSAFGRALLRSRLPLPSQAWELTCFDCGAVVDSLCAVPALWPVQSPDGSWVVAPEGPQLLFGDPADGVSLGRQSAAGESGRAFEARDLSLLATLQSDGLWFVCPQEPAVFCRDEVLVDELEPEADDQGWTRRGVVHEATYPDGHTREISLREFLD